MKRVFDMLAASTGLIAMAPLMIIIALVIFATNGRPVLFRQQRAGLKGKPFLLVKFRTMDQSRASDGQLFSDASRITATGRFLRETSLDELPELWNVIRGDMSLVGPRPLLMEYLPLYTTDQIRRHDVRPGITGWAQVSGRNALSWDEKFAHDIWYVQHNNFLLDVRILAMTIFRVLRREGIAHQGNATMPPFRGSTSA